MKKALFIVLFACLASAVTNTVNAQDAVKNRVGFFLAFASGDYDEIGIGGIGEFRVGQKVTISPQLIFYFPEEDVNLLEINGNVNYYFYNHDIFEFYGLGGLNITRVSWDYGNDVDGSETELGLNLGGGINFEVGKSFVPFSELRFTLGDFDQFVISAGLKFNLR